MPQEAPRELSALLGPQPDALSAYRHAASEHLFISQEESDQLGAAIYEGRLSAACLADPELSTNISRHESNIKAGLQARRTMVSHHLQLVIGISRRFASNVEGKIDKDREAELIGVGNVALSQCMDGYRHVPGEHFVRFAARCVTNAMIEEMRVNIRSATGRSQRMQRELRAIEAEYQIAQEAGVDMSFLEAGEKLGYSPERIQQILRLEQKHVYSLDDLLQRGRISESTLEDPSAQEAFVTIEDERLLNEIWKTAEKLREQQIITDSEWAVLTGRFREGLTQKVIGQRWGRDVEQSYISMLEKKVLNKIRQEIEQPGVQAESRHPSSHSKKRAIDLLMRLEIPIDEKTDVLAVARTIADALEITDWQREVMHALLGTNGMHFQTKEFAQHKGVTAGAIYDAHKKAMRNILTAWSEMSSEERSAILSPHQKV